MVRALIVDDEEWIRLGLREQVDWNALGIETIEEAQNGLAAIDIIEKKRPEIVITDIRMPKMDGIELMEYINKKFPEIVVIVVSGYSEFEYAKKALSFSAFNYLLKPIEEKELEKTLKKAVEKIKENKNKKESVLSLKVELNENNRLVREKVLTDFILGAEGRCEELELFDSSRRVILVLRAANFCDLAEKKYNNDIELASFALENVVKEIIKNDKGVVLFRNYIRREELILNKDCGGFPETNLKEQIGDLGKRIIEAVEKYLQFQVYIGVSREFKSSKETAANYLDALEAVQNAGMFRSERICYFEKGLRSHTVIYSEDMENTLLNYIENNHKTHAEELIEQIFRNIENSQTFNSYSIRSSVLELTTNIGRLVKNYADTGEENFSDRNMMNKVINELFTLHELKDYLKDTSLKAMSLINDKKRIGSAKTIDQIVHYIDQHFREPINLNSISEKFYLNAAYLSRVFKNEVGENFNDYLSRKRMDSAVELLKHSELKMNDISEMIGYENVNYFLKKFKEHYHCTPTEFKKRRSI